MFAESEGPVFIDLTIEEDQDGEERRFGDQLEPELEPEESLPSHSSNEEGESVSDTDQNGINCPPYFVDQ